MTAERRARYRADHVRRPGGHHIYAVGLLVPRAASRHLLHGRVSATDDRWVEWPRDLPRLAGMRGLRLDGDRYLHRVALVRSGGRVEWLEHRCADNGQAHAPPGHHSWGDSGHEAQDLAYSLLTVRIGGSVAGESGPIPGEAFASLFDVIAMLPRAFGWRMAWDRGRCSPAPCPARGRARLRTRSWRGPGAG